MLVDGSARVRVAAEVGSGRAGGRAEPGREEVEEEGVDWGGAVGRSPGPAVGRVAWGSPGSADEGGSAGRGGGSASGSPRGSACSDGGGFGVAVDTGSPPSPPPRRRRRPSAATAHAALALAAERQNSQRGAAGSDPMAAIATLARRQRRRSEIAATSALLAWPGAEGEGSPPESGRGSAGDDRPGKVDVGRAAAETEGELDGTGLEGGGAGAGRLAVGEGGAGGFANDGPGGRRRSGASGRGGGRARRSGAGRRGSMVSVPSWEEDEVEAMTSSLGGAGAGGGGAGAGGGGGSGVGAGRAAAAAAAAAEEEEESEDEEEAMRALWEDVRGTSRVGRRIGNLIKKQVIVGVIGIVFLLPLLAYDPPSARTAVPRTLALVDEIGPGTVAAGASGGFASLSEAAVEVSGNATVAAAAAAAAREAVVTRLLADRPDILFLRLEGGADGGLVRRGLGGAAPRPAPAWPGPLSLGDVASGSVLPGLAWDAAVYVLRSSDAASLRADEMSSFVSAAGSQVVLDSSVDARLASLLSFFQTQAVIVVMGILAGALQQSVDVLLVWPIEKLSGFLRPVLTDAITTMTKAGAGGGGAVAAGRTAERWRRTLGADDGEEMSTKLMLAAVEVLRRDLSAEARRNWARKALVAQMQNGDRAAAGIKRSMQWLRRTDQLNEGGGLRFQPVDDAEAARRAAKAGGSSAGATLRSRTSVVPYAGLEVVKEARKPSAAAEPGAGEGGGLTGVAEDEEDEDDSSEEDEEEIDEEGEDLLSAMFGGDAAREEAAALAAT